MEVYDAELHATEEALKYLTTLDLSPNHVYLCIDNQAAILTLKSNPAKVQMATDATKSAHRLQQMGWRINTVWTPAHIGISGNEEADLMAKKGTQDEDRLCDAACITKTWIERTFREKLLKGWGDRIGTSNITWKYPKQWEAWNFREANAYFRTYCGRTWSDTSHGENPKKCACGESDLSTDHLIGSCRLLEIAREKMRMGRIDAPHFVKELVLDTEWGETVRGFLRKTKIGFKDQITTDKVACGEENRSDTSDEEDFDVETFE